MTDEPEQDETKRSEGKTIATRLVDDALGWYEFAVTPEGEPFAIPLPGGHIIRPLRGGRSSLRTELARMYRSTTGRVAPAAALSDALTTLEGEALDSRPRPVHLRVAEGDGAVWIDLGDLDERAVRFAAGAWSIERACPQLFRRTALTGQFVEPEHGGTLEELWSLLNIAEADRPLLLAWIVAALVRPNIPHPVLALLGEQGTGKSSVSRAIVMLTDPSPVALRKPPRDSEGWVTAASSSWVVGLDNLSQVPDWFSDSLCRAVTGDGDVRRALYTDQDVTVFSFRRAIVANGIDLGATRGDLAERLLVVDLDRINPSRRQGESALARVWRDAGPRILGAIFDLSASVHALLPTIEAPRDLPRMADFALVLTAVDQVLGTDGMSRYVSRASALAQDSLATVPFLVELPQYIVAFDGTAAELLASVVKPEIVQARDWPKNAKEVAATLKRNAPALRNAGWTIESAPGHDNKLRWALRAPLAQPDKTRIPSHPSPHPSADGGDGGMGGTKYGPSLAEEGW